MRTTLTLDEDVAQNTRRLARKLHLSFKKTVNQALRQGIEVLKKPTESKPYRTHGHVMEQQPGVNLDNIHEVLSQIEGENYR